MLLKSRTMRSAKNGRRRLIANASCSYQSAETHGTGCTASTTASIRKTRSVGPRHKDGGRMATWLPGCARYTCARGSRGTSDTLQYALYLTS